MLGDKTTNLAMYLVYLVYVSMYLGYLSKISSFNFSFTLIFLYPVCQKHTKHANALVSGFQGFRASGVEKTGSL